MKVNLWDLRFSNSFLKLKAEETTGKKSQSETSVWQYSFAHGQTCRIILSVLFYFPLGHIYSRALHPSANKTVDFPEISKLIKLKWKAIKT